MHAIVALIDLSDVPLSTEVLSAARKLAQLTHHRLELLNVEMPDSTMDAGGSPIDISRNAMADRLRSRHRKLRILALEVQHLGVDATALMVRSKSLRGNPAGKILQEINRLKPEFVVVGSHGYGVLHQLFLGSVSEAVIRHTRRPVLVIPIRRTRGKSQVSDRAVGVKTNVAVRTSLVTVKEPPNPRK